MGGLSGHGSEHILPESTSTCLTAITIGKVACEGQIEKSRVQEVPLASKGNLLSPLAESTLRQHVQGAVPLDHGSRVTGGRRFKGKV